jgi:hypothetical protein
LRRLPCFGAQQSRNAADNARLTKLSFRVGPESGKIFFLEEVEAEEMQNILQSVAS